MSTRATYCFFTNDSQNEIRARHFCYIHYDGYPAGAAAYFYDTLMNPSKGNFATQFIRANQHAELTRSHDQHGDTEYQYDVTGSGANATIHAYRLTDDPHSISGRVHIFSGELHAFIAWKPELITGFKPFKQVTIGYHGQRHMNEPMAAQILQNPLRHLRIWRDGNRNSANWQSCVREAQQIVDAFPALMTDELREFGVVLQEEPA